MVDSKNIVLGAVSGALAASLVLIVAHAATPSTAKPKLHPLARAQLDAPIDAAADAQAGQAFVRTKDQSSLLSVVQVSSAAPSADVPFNVNAKAVLSPATRECLRIAGLMIDWGNASVADKHRHEWRAACEKAYVLDGDKAGGCELATKSGGDQDLIAKAAKQYEAKSQ